MYKTLKITILVLLVSTKYVCAQTYFDWNKRIEYIGFITKADVNKIDSFATYSVEKVIGENVYLNLNKYQYNNVIARSIKIYPDNRKNTKSATALNIASTVAEMLQWNAYPTYDTYLQMMYGFQDSFPEICKVDTIGYSINNRLILAVKISDYVNKNETEPKFLYTSSMHGDEVAGIVMMLRLANQLLTQYGSDELITKLVDSVEIYINPIANPDGTYAGGNNNISNATRRNANGIDLNRNFPDPASGLYPDGNERQPENIAMMNYISTKYFSLSMNIHSGEEVLNYPWDTWSKLHADNDWYYLISREFADTVHSYSSNYLTNFDNGVTNGYAWYSIDGGRQDYVNYFTNGREITFEIAESKLFDSNMLPTLWNYNYKSFLNYIKQSLYGIYGNITDIYGNAINAKIEITNHDKDSSHIYSNTNGMFFRYLKESVYTIRFTAPHYDTLVLTNVNINDFSKYVINITMNPISNRTYVNTSNTSPFCIFPNPSSGTVYILPQNNTEYFKVDIYNTKGQLINSQTNNGTVTIKHLNKGLYLLNICSKNNSATSKIIVE